MDLSEEESAEDLEVDDISRYFFDSGSHVHPPQYVEQQPNTVLRIPIWPLRDTVLLPGCTMPLKGKEGEWEYTKAFARVEMFEEDDGDAELHPDFSESGEMEGVRSLPDTTNAQIQATSEEITEQGPTPTGEAPPLSYATPMTETPESTTVSWPDGHPDSAFYPVLGAVTVNHVDDEETNTRKMNVASVGVIVEIKSCAWLTRESGFGMVVCGRQTFKVIKTEKKRHMLWATVVVFSETPMRTHFFPLRKNRLVPASTKFMRYRDHVHLTTCCPSWAVKKYDPYSLLEQVITAAHGVINMPKIPEKEKSDPETASYRILSNLVMSDKARLEFLEMPTPIRLQKLIEVFDTYSMVCCAQCGMVVADTNEMFCMSNDMVQNSFVNKHGFVHDTITFNTVSCQLVLLGKPTAKDSWYPGYTWTIILCSGCTSHLGWLFRATREELDPKVFFGMSRRSLNRVQKERQ